MADRYGSQVGPQEPRADMTAIDIIAGSVHDRRSSPAQSTGGDTETGLGGHAEGGPDGGTMYPPYD